MAKTTATTMDSRKYLTIVNNSPFAIARVVTESFKAQTGLKDVMPVGFDGNRLMVEDTKRGIHYAVNFAPKRGDYVIESYEPLNLMNGDRSETYTANCLSLVESLLADKQDQNKISESFYRIAGNRYSRKSIPSHGIVKTRDGVVHKIAVFEEIQKRKKTALAESIGRAYKAGSKILNEDSTAAIGNVKFALHRYRARCMRTIAESASKDAGFNNVVAHIANQVNNHDLAKGVSIAKNFLREFQEFSTLDKAKFTNLIEESCAASGILNDDLIRDTAELMWRTNIGVNSKAIVKEWRIAAQNSGNTTLLENVSILADTPNGLDHYDQFINAIFCEGVTGPNQIQAGAYKTALQALLNVPTISGEPAMKNHIVDLMERLTRTGDQHAILEAEEVLANANSEAQGAGINLENFDAVNDIVDMPDLSPEAEENKEKAGSGNVVFNINISGDGKSVDVNNEDALQDATPPAPPAPPAPENAIGDTGGMPTPSPGSMSGGGPGQQAGQVTFESYNQYANVLTEHVGRPPMFFGHDYGVSPLSYEDTVAATAVLKGILAESLDSDANLTALAISAITKSNFVIPKNRLEEAAKSVVDSFVASNRSVLEEDQYKFPRIKKTGLKRSSIKAEKEAASEASPAKSDTVDESYVYTHHDGTAVLIEGNNSQYFVSNLSGTIKEPVPTNVVSSMLFAVKASDSGDPKIFEDWVGQGIDQFLLDESATIVTVDEDGTVSVDQSDDDTGETINIAEIKPVVDDHCMTASGSDDGFGGDSEFPENEGFDDFSTEETVDTETAATDAIDSVDNENEVEPEGMETDGDNDEDDEDEDDEPSKGGMPFDKE